jgi:hypothetical protein
MGGCPLKQCGVRPGPFDAADVVSTACPWALGSSRLADVENERAYMYRTVYNVASGMRRLAMSRRLRGWPIGFRP